MLGIKVALSIALTGGLVWVMILQSSRSVVRRIALAVVGLVILFALFALVVSVRCDLGWLPADEC